jgi:Tropinone reductase 1
MSGSSSSSSSSSRWSLQDKKALITGGTKGIGRSAVKEFCELGAEVIFCARNADEVQAMESEFKGLGLLVHGFAADITQSGDRESLIRQASELFGGKLDILVNNVGTNIRKPSLEYTEEEYQRISDINLKAMFSLTSELHPLLKRAAAASGTAGGSSVVNISSVAGQTAINSGIVYAGTKAAINMYTEYWGCEWAKDNIRVNCVAPWYTRTPLVTEVLQNEAKVCKQSAVCIPTVTSPDTCPFCSIACCYFG